MFNTRITHAISATLLTATVAFALADAPTLADRAKDNKALIVPDDHAEQGTVYHVLPDRDRQIHFSSEAPLEDINGQSNKVLGYAVAPSDSPASLAAGQWQLPVNSLRTGIKLRDEHLAGSDWLDADNHPYITFNLADVKDIKETKAADTFTTYSATLVGTMTIHGITNDITIENATLTFLPESDKTKQVAPGDLLAIRATYSVTLSDYDVSHPTIGSKVSDNVDIDTVLYMSTHNPSSNSQ